ncbi:E3 ubiquitin-protein ligase MYCBP2 [Holothuria leucospilota]|uniref:RCR-type E3 ubiquitin transferase n=1 Tax=Holothuria leucospilota TaxID=206669 RepID=A0A9Q1BJR3_HOLLE|nr:E3 ubiquitin-protein ligase MYCBP2 [Holothuria leucospilota]
MHDMGSTMAEHIEHVLQLRQFLRDDAKSSMVFHQLFKKTSQEKPPSLEKQKKKKSPKDGKDKSKDKTETEDQLELFPPKIEIQNNASSFSVYTAIRQAILERETLTRKYIQGKVGDIEQDGEEDDEKLENIFMLPKVVGFGLRSVFELIRETRKSHPSFCTRALKALLDMLQGLAPEELAGEPSDITDPLFDLLLDLTTNHQGEEENADDLQSLSAACLISLIIARGETGKILAGLSALLMHGHRSPFHTVEVPSNVVALQSSISALLVGKTVFPDWPNMGVPESALLFSFPVQIKTTDPGPGTDHRCAIASNGSFLYIHSNVGLFKVGSGYGNTLQGHIYAANPSFYSDYKGWLVVVRGRLYFYPQSLRTEGAAAPAWYTQLLWVDLDTLQEKGSFEIEDISPEEQLFSDGVNLGHMCTSSPEEFSASFYKIGSNALIDAGRMSSELTKKRLVLSDNVTPGMTKEEKETSPGVPNPVLDGDVQYIGVGKEFTLCRDADGKLYFIGKGQALGMKESSSAKSSHMWSELTRGKSILFEDCCVWHEGLPAVFLGNDGTTYLCLGGHASHQEQGEQGRRVIKASKPIKLQGMEGKTPIRCACNNGTTAVVTKEGDLYLFGKLYPNKEDADPDQSPGLVTSLKGTKMEKVALGKSHGCAISSEGDVFTFGVNNKGQCGRGGPGNDAEKDGEKVDMSVIDIEDDFEDEEKEKGEDPCDHDWIQSECMVCTQCGECTGYGAQCINSTMPNRKPGMLCGCGAGDAGCSKCRICKSCAGEPHAMRGNLGGVRLNQVALYKMGWLRPDDRGKGDDNNLSGDELKEVEKAVSKPTILPPEEIMIHPDTNVRAKEASCGFHHTVILLDNGEVYTFGSNSYGQLGQGDTTNRLSPVKVKVAEKIKQVSAGSYHTLLLTECGKVYSFGRCQKGQLCRPVFEGTNNAEAMSHTIPAEVAEVGPEKGNKAVWIGASGDRSFIKVDEALISPHMLESATIFASKSAIGILPQGEDCPQRCMIIDRNFDNCESFSDPNQVKFDGCCVCTDPIYNSLLWSFDPRQNTIQCYSPLKAAAGSRLALSDNLSILGPELSLPSQPQVQVSSYQVALNILGCLDVLSMSLEKGLTVEDTLTRKEETTPDSKVEDFSFVNRFEGYGGGWGYSGHSVEAIIFSVDTDIQLGGFGLFGGRGEYTAKIKLYQLETMRAHLDSEGELKAESEEKTYECGAKEEFPILFDEPVSITAGMMYLAWAKVNGPSSDCGSGGQAIVTTEDKVTFHFLSSRKSNNGTDVSAGQIPKLYYRIPNPEQNSTTQPKGKDFPLHVLTSAFCWTVSPEAFESLLLLLQWAWTSFSKKMEQSLKVDEEEMQPIIKDLTSLSYICSSCLRLAKSFVCDVFPNPASSRKSKPGRTNQLPQCISSTCKLLRKILQQEAVTRQEQLSPTLLQLEADIVEECQRTFIHCFHAFCPTSQLKWVFFCELLGQQDKEQGTNGSRTLLTAVLGALCDPSIKLTRVLPLLKVQEPDPYPFLKEKGNTDKNNLDDNSPMGVDMDRGNLLADLISHIESNLKGEQQVAMNTSFQEILDQLLHILSVPIRTALEEKSALPVYSIQTNTSNFLVCVIGELASLATNCEAPYHSPTRPMLTTPSRYTRTNQSYNWSTCNGTPDAVCFSVNQAGIQIAGICVYTGLGQYNYELELLDGVEAASDAHGPRWNSLEFARGVFAGEDAVDKLVEVKFDKPVSVKEGVKYAIRLRLHGGKTFSGEGGSSQVRCPDGVTFTFSNCTLSSNGTSLARGQIPQVLYYNHQSVENKNSLPEGSKSMEMEQQARNSLFTVTQAVIRQAMDVLARALCFEEPVVPHILRSSPLFSHLLPLTLAYIGPVAASHPKSSVQTLNFIRDILPQVATLNTMFVPQTMLPSHPTDSPVLQLKEGSEVTRSQRYVVLESDHPYQPATVCHFKVSFPCSVKWMTLEFGSECGTSQPEDSLQLYIGACQSTDSHQSTPSVTVENEVPARYWPVMSKFHGRTNWPSSAVVLPGHEVIFSLCTASDYVKDKKANRFGFKCHVFGYEQNSLSELGLVQLEKELCYLGGLCSAALLKKDIPLSSFLAEGEEDIEPIAEAAQEVFTAHSALLGKGFSLSQPLTIQQALKGHLPLQTQSNEKLFLQDFVQNVADTSGGRLASWFQPDSYVDPKHCDIVLPKQGLSCSIPSQLTIHTRDQYGSLVYVSGLKVEVEAVPSARNESSFSSPSATKTDSSSQNTTFGGLPVPKMETTYQPTLRRESSLYISITMMKDYEQYSFEELRLAYMPSSRPTETVLVRDNQDGTFSANWTPGSIGVYSLQVKIDGYLLDGLPPIEVSEPPYGIIPSSVAPKKQEVKAKMRKFVAKNSSGLRIRTSPSLKSEQIGIVKVDGVVAFTEELQNGDGVWVRLTFDSIKKFCPDNGHHKEGWCLQYNQHIGKTLLVPVEDPKPLFKDPLTLEQEEAGTNKELVETKVGGPGMYHVINCGPSGHNIRCKASLKASAIGMMVSGNVLKVIADRKGNDGGLWVQLDKESIAQYCEGKHTEAWALAASKGQVYLSLKEVDPKEKLEGEESLGVTGQRRMSSSGPGFDFKNTQGPPQLEFASNGEIPAFGVGKEVSSVDEGGHAEKQSTGVHQRQSRTSQSEEVLTPSTSDDSSQSTPSKNGVKNTSPQKVVSKGQFTIGSGEGSPKSGVSPKLSRRPRVGSRRSRSSSPAGKEHSPSRTKMTPPKQDGKEQFKPALATSVCECARAVFAAFLWHEGLVHDAMACASFLKFNPGLTKAVAYDSGEENVQGNKREHKLKNRHSMDLSKAMKERDFPVDIIALNINENGAVLRKRLESGSSIGPKEEELPEEDAEWRDRASSVGGAAKTDQDVKKPIAPKATPITVPVTLKNLLTLWDDISEATVNIASQSLVLPSPAPIIKTSNFKTAEMKEIPRPREPKGKKRRDRPGKGGRGNLFGDAAGAPIGGEKHESVCELCFGVFPRPVTFHMKNAHPGCGRTAQGYGYNSSGTYCGGWAGNCGDGGMAGSSWYLMCLRCRSKYTHDRQDKMKDKEKVKKMKKKLPPLKTPKVIPPLEAHHVMKANALFLLDLASASGPSFSHKCQSIKMQRRFDMPAVKETDTISAENPFPVVQFQFLKNSPMSPEEIDFGDMVQHTDYEGIPAPSRSVPALNLSVTNNEDNTLKSNGHRKSSYLRSVSMLVQDGQREMKMRRRNYSGSADDGSSLLRRPSPRLASLMEESMTGILPLNRPSMRFMVRHHDLEGLKLAMKQSLCKAACKIHALQGLNWLLRSVTQPVCIHDLLWHFVGALSPVITEKEGEEEEKGKDAKNGKDVKEEVKEVAAEPEKDQEGLILEHPLEDILVMEEAVSLLPVAFHDFLQTVSNLMLVLPHGGALQKMALQCWSMKFRTTDHMFLHQSHVFSNINRILSKSDEVEAEDSSVEERQEQPFAQLQYLADITNSIECEVSSRSVMVGCLTDGSTETFWESGDEDRNKPKVITIKVKDSSTPAMVAVHIDNSRDLRNKVNLVTLSAGAHSTSLQKVKQNNLDLRFVGWVTFDLEEFSESKKVMTIDVKGPDSHLRVRQIKVLGIREGDHMPELLESDLSLQPMDCISESLRIFRLLTSQVFGRLLAGEVPTPDGKVTPEGKPLEEDGDTGDPDLREHMVGILFSRSRLTSLQKQVCSHIVLAIHKEASRMQEYWEGSITDGDNLSQGQNGRVDAVTLSDAYCFELLSMVLALSYSGVGRAYVAQQTELLQDLLSLLHTSTPRVQRQVTSILRKVLPEISPSYFARVVGVTNLPSLDIVMLSQEGHSSSSSSGIPQKGVLDVFLACIAKALTVQVKAKGSGGSKAPQSTSVAKTFSSPKQGGVEHQPATEGSQDTVVSHDHWYLRGTMSSNLAEQIISLIKDMSKGEISSAWTDITKSAVAEAVLSLTRIPENVREPVKCLQESMLWLSLASLCVLEPEHVDRLSTSQRAQNVEKTPNKEKPTCENHDDGMTLAIIECDTCGTLCAECDRILHLPKSKRHHQRKVFKEEEDSIKVDLHEGCGRSKLYWITALADSKTLKAMVEFKQTSAENVGVSGSHGVCRFCGNVAAVGLGRAGNVCSDAECKKYSSNICSKRLSCGHLCGGIRDESPCLPCLHGCSKDPTLKQDAEDMCMICFTEALSCAPAIQLDCGHVFHQHCCKAVLEKRWVGPRITFGFTLCPICKASINHKSLKDDLDPIQALEADVRRKALMRLEYEGLDKCEAVTTPGARYHNNPAGFAMNRYAYYVCFKCQKAYYGGEARCDQDAAAAGSGDFNPAELICGGCSDVARAQLCPKHGTDYLEYKCRYCCSVAVYFCFGSTHFCNPCHDNFQWITSMSKSELPHCPAGPGAIQLEGEECPLHVEHPATGEEFALGCGICRNTHTF